MQTIFEFTDLNDQLLDSQRRLAALAELDPMIVDDLSDLLAAGDSLLEAVNSLNTDLEKVGA